MSLDVYLTIPCDIKQEKCEPKIFIRESGMTREISKSEWELRFPDREPHTMAVENPKGETEVFSYNITHNLRKMAEEAGIYKCLWRPNEVGINKADQLVEPLRAGLDLLRSDPDRFEQFNPSNGWGTYDGLVRFVEEYLQACKQYPDAYVSAWR